MDKSLPDQISSGQHGEASEIRQQHIQQPLPEQALDLSRKGNPPASSSPHCSSRDLPPRPKTTMGRSCRPRALFCSESTLSEESIASAPNPSPFGSITSPLKSQPKPSCSSETFRPNTFVVIPQTSGTIAASSQPVKASLRSSNVKRHVETHDRSINDTARNATLMLLPPSHLAGGPREFAELPPLVIPKSCRQPLFPCTQLLPPPSKHNHLLTGGSTITSARNVLPFQEAPTVQELLAACSGRHLFGAPSGSLQDVHRSSEEMAAASALAGSSPQHDATPPSPPLSDWTCHPDCGRDDQRTSPEKTNGSPATVANGRCAATSGQCGAPVGNEELLAKEDDASCHLQSTPSSPSLCNMSDRLDIAEENNDQPSPEDSSVETSAGNDCTATGNKQVLDANQAANAGCTSAEKGAAAATSGNVEYGLEQPEVPDEKKDWAYWERRRKNNAAAKKSREARKARIRDITTRTTIKEQENKRLARSINMAHALLRCLLPDVYADLVSKQEL